MIKEMLMMASYGFYGGEIGDMLSELEAMGFFTYVLPFLVLFALILGILTQVKLFKETKGLNAIIALAVSLLALQFEFVPRFFSEIFPRLGVGLAIILIGLILLGLFLPDQTWVTYALFGGVVIVMGVILIQAAGVLNWPGAYIFYDNWRRIVIWAVVILLIIIVAATVRGKDDNAKSPIRSIIQAAINDLK